MSTTATIYFLAAFLLVGAGAVRGAQGEQLSARHDLVAAGIFGGIGALACIRPRKVGQ